MSTNPIGQAYKDFQAGKIRLEQLYAIIDAEDARDRAEQERDELLRSLKKQSGWKPFVSIGINIPLK